MESFHFNNVKAEKAEAIRRYNRQRKLKNFLFLVEVVAVLALLSWSCCTYIPIVSEKVKDFILQNVAVYGHSLIVFVFVNVLVLLIYVSSSQRPTEPDLFENITTTTTTNVPRPSIETPAADVAPQEPVVDKQIVWVKNAVTSPSVPQATVRSPTMRDYEKKRTVEVPPVGGVTESDKRKYTRSRSERFEKVNRRELRRSETVVNREMVAVSNGPARRSIAMDDLSGEEFRLEVETFIALKKKTLIRENTLDLKRQRNECVAITLRACN